MSSRSCKTHGFEAAFPAARMPQSGGFWDADEQPAETDSCFFPRYTVIRLPHGRFFNRMTRDWRHNFTINQLTFQVVFTLD